MPNAPTMRRPPADAPRFGGSTSGEGRRMVVAKDITLAGQISKCDYLVVEGGVEGMRYDGQALEVTEGGTFNGSIEVDTAEIAGSFEGVVVVRGRLTVRPTGRITGTVRYGEIEINAGGQVNGELQGMQPSARPAVTSSYNSSSDDDDSDASSERLAGE
jgi:cytoskeletal protein CcmA (bactofilin family)